MKQLIVFVKKEFRHVFRDRKTLLMLFGLPIVQIVLFGFALTNEIKNARIAILDYSHDVATKQITDKIEASKYFDIEKTLLNHDEIEPSFKEGKIKLAIIFPQNFYNNLLHENKAQIQIIADASDINTANTLTNYVSFIVRDYQRELMKTSSLPLTINPEVRMLYNPELKGEHMFVPGIMAMIMLLICVMMTSISIVKEKELGTMEILLVSPFKPVLVIISKFIPYLIISLVNVTSILLLAVYALHLEIDGSLLLLYAESLLFIITGLTIGLLISISAESQQTAMFGSMMATMLPTLLLSGFMFPIENMPVPLQIISNVVPSKWFFIIIKNIIHKGVGLEVVWKETLILIGMTMFFLFISIRKFKIRLG
jgi:ABC-2 type transport system permease protein